MSKLGALIFVGYFFVLVLLLFVAGLTALLAGAGGVPK